MKITRTFTLAGAPKVPAVVFNIRPEPLKDADGKATDELGPIPDPLRKLVFHWEPDAKEKFGQGPPSGELHIVVAPEDGTLVAEDLVVDTEWIMTLERVNDTPKAIAPAS